VPARCPALAGYRPRDDLACRCTARRGVGGSRLPEDLFVSKDIPRALLALAPLLLGMAEGEPPTPPDPLPLEWLLEQAEAANPAIAMDTASAAAAEHRITPAGALDDPRLGYSATNLPVGDLGFDSTPMSGNQFWLRQKFPFPGVLSNSEEAARAGASAATSNVDDRRIRVRSAVERAFSELGFAQRGLGITERNLDLLRQFTRIAEAKYRVGTGLQQDVLRAQVELTSLLQERLRRVESIAAAEAVVNSLLDRPANSRYPRTEDLAETAPLPDLDELLTRLETASPRLHALRARIDEAKRLERATRFQGYPDFDLGFGYRLRQQAPGDPVDGDDFISAGVTIRLPVNRTKWRERVAERAALVRRAKAAYRDERARLGGQIRAAFAELGRADSEVALLGTGLVPQARQSLDSSRSGYQVNKVDFLSLIDSQVRLIDSELLLVRAVADRRAAFAGLEAAVGERLR
jgi:outer membrane protein TolC